MTRQYAVSKKHIERLVSAARELAATAGGETSTSTSCLVP